MSSVDVFAGRRMSGSRHFYFVNDDVVIYSFLCNNEIVLFNISAQ